MTSVLDADQLRRMVKPLDNPGAWVAKMTQEIEDQFFRARASGT
jgi:hypothetical protein